MWVRNRRKRFYGEIWGNAVRGGGTCKNPARLSMKDGPMETVEYMWVNIWWMFIYSFFMLTIYIAKILCNICT